MVLNERVQSLAIKPHANKKQPPKFLITRTHKNYLGSGHRLPSPEQLHRPTVLRNVETANSKNNYKIISNEAANS